MKLGYGLITCQRYPGDNRTASDLYREAMDRARSCESAGLDSVWTSEHHFWDDDYMPSLLVTSAALGAVTQTITIGTAVLLAPLYHPIRLAEDAATVALISGGRFVLGIGIGWRAEEFDVLDVRMSDLGRKMTEIVKVLKLAWKNEAFSFDGPNFSFEKMNVTPKPPEPIPIWLGGFADPAIRRAGRIADGYLGSSSRRTTPIVDEMRRRVAIAKEGLEKAGREPSEFTLAFHEPIWVSEDPETEFEEIVSHVYYSGWKYADMGSEFGREPRDELPKPPDLDEARKKSIRDNMILGTPQQVAEQIAPLREAVGENLHLIARSYWPGLSLEKSLRCIELLGEVKKLL
jgi:alkanesulfonate monooxygenase SsuD/methylene tetrahydromethanopterin reductase-like flavin-dependent oxidoreductase (luciferase family)